MIKHNKQKNIIDGVLNKKQDILIVKDGATTGKVSFVGSNFPYEECAVNEHVFIVKADTNTIIQALFYEMFGDPQTNPKNWKITTLLEVSNEKPKYGSGASAITFDNKVRYIRITDVNEDGSLRYDSVASPSEVEDEYFLKKGDLLFARSGATVGKTYLHKEEKSNSIYAGYMIRFRFKEQICNPVFVNAITKTKYYKNWLLSNQTQVAQPNINAQQYGSFKIIIPPISLQNQFASLVEKIESVKEHQTQSTEEINTLFGALMQKAFSGELI